MRLIDADALMEHVYRDKLDSRELIADMVKNAPTFVESEKELLKMCEELKAQVNYLSRENNRMIGQIKALAFAVRCNGSLGNEVAYEID